MKVPKHIKDALEKNSRLDAMLDKLHDEWLSLHKFAKGPCALCVEYGNDSCVACPIDELCDEFFDALIAVYKGVEKALDLNQQIRLLLEQEVADETDHDTTPNG